MHHQNSFTRTASIAVLTAVSILLSLVSCGEAGQPTPDPPGTEDGVGTVSIAIPPYAEWLDDAFVGLFAPASASDSPRAFAIADRVELSVYDSTDTLVDSGEFTPTPAADGSVTLSMDVPVGTGYELTVSIYNSYESETDPTVAGTSAAFDITDGQTTSVTVTCTPVSPTNLPLGGSAESFSQVNYVVVGEDMTATGGETWVTFTAPANGTVMFTADIPDDMALGILLFDSQGLSAADLTLCNADGPLYITGLTPGAFHYGLAMLVDETTTNQVAHSFTLAAAQGYTISGTVTIPDVTDPATLPSGEGVFLNSTLSANPDFSAMTSWVSMGQATVTGSDLTFAYSLPYDGDETAILFATRVADTAAWPAEGDYFGVAPQNVDVDIDLLNLTGIQTAHFSDDMTGVDFELQLLEADAGSGTVNVIID